MSWKVGAGGITEFGVWEVGCPKVASPRLLNLSVISSNIPTTIPIVSVPLYIPQRASTNILINLFNNYNKNWHFLFPINHVPGALQMLSHLILDYYESPFYRQNRWGSATWCDLTCPRLHSYQVTWVRICTEVISSHVSYTEHAFLLRREKKKTHKKTTKIENDCCGSLGESGHLG